MILVAADAVHKLRRSLLEPAGIPWVINILVLPDKQRKCKHVKNCWAFLFELSQLEWGVQLLVESDLSAALVQLRYVIIMYLYSYL